MTHKAILREVWGPAYQQESSYLHVYVSQLRRKLEPDPTRPRIHPHRAGCRVPPGEPRRDVFRRSLGRPRQVLDLLETPGRTVARRWQARFTRRRGAGDATPPPLLGLRGGFGRLKARRALRAARAEADTELLLRETPPLRLAWRVEELVAAKNRLDLAHTIRSLVRDAGPGYLPSASPVNRLAVRAHSDALLAIASRLADLSGGVAARGVLLVDRLLVGRLRAAVRPHRAGELGVRPRDCPRRPGAHLMFELLGIAIAVACFAFAFALIVAPGAASDVRRRRLRARRALARLRLPPLRPLPGERL